jgi:hypothetical protein
MAMVPYVLVVSAAAIAVVFGKIIYANSNKEEEKQTSAYFDTYVSDTNEMIDDEEPAIRFRRRENSDFRMNSQEAQEAREAREAREA